MANFQLLIGGVDYTSYYQRETLTIKESLQVRGFSLQCDIRIVDQAVTAPLEGQTVILIGLDAVTREFAGRISVVTQIQAGGPTNLTYRIECADWTDDFDRHLYHRDANAGQQLAGDLIRSLVGFVGNGFTSVNVSDGILVNIPAVDYEYPSNVIQRIAESIEHSWYIDYNRDVHFYPSLNAPAPVTTINVDTDLDTYSDMEIVGDISQVKNRLILKGGKAKSTTTIPENFVGDGSQKFFGLGYEPWDLSSISVLLAGVAQTMLLDTTQGRAGDGTGAAGQVYICFDNWGVRFPDSAAPGVGQSVAISYNFSYDPIVIVDDPTSIATIRARENDAYGPSDGVHELRFEIPDIRVDTESTIYDYGLLILIRYKDIRRKVSFSSYKQGWVCGQNLIVSSAVGRRNFTQVMYVTSVQKRIRVITPTTAELDYDIEVQSNPFVG